MAKKKSESTVHYWLVKSEPYKYSWSQFLKDGKASWDGVRNYQARNNLRAMNLGDQVLFYHSNEGLEIVGIAEVVKTHYQDPTTKDPQWSAVDIAPGKTLSKAVSLSVIKAEKKLADIALVRQGRLSVIPIKPKEFEIILQLSNA